MLPDDEELLVDAAGVDDSFLGAESFLGDESPEEVDAEEEEPESELAAGARESVR